MSFLSALAAADPTAVYGSRTAKQLEDEKKTQQAEVGGAKKPPASKPLIYIPLAPEMMHGAKIHYESPMEIDEDYHMADDEGHSPAPAVTDPMDLGTEASTRSPSPTSTKKCATEDDIQLPKITKAKAEHPAEQTAFIDTGAFGKVPAPYQEAKGDTANRPRKRSGSRRKEVVAFFDDTVSASTDPVPMSPVPISPTTTQEWATWTTSHRRQVLRLALIPKTTTRARTSPRTITPTLVARRLVPTLPYLYVLVQASADRNAMV